MCASFLSLSVVFLGFLWMNPRTEESRHRIMNQATMNLPAVEGHFFILQGIVQYADF